MSVAIDRLAAEVAGTSGDVATRAQLLTAWLHEALDWVKTDYQQRSVDEILERRAGNCAEQAKVLDALLQAAGIETRWMAELNVHPASARRQADSEALIAEYGMRATVFGYQHNDHRWLEIHEPASGDWLPADATLALVGYRDWIEARLGFGERPEAAAEMLVPFCVVVLDLDRILHEDRTSHYLIEKFNAHYDGRLEQLPGWEAWGNEVGALGTLGARTFEGGHDLHSERARIARLRDTYDQLAAEACESGRF